MFAVEPSRQPGPQGGKPRGYTLAWRGRGFAPHGRSQRSGWYLYREAADRAAGVANEAVARDLARPAREAVQIGDGSHVVRLVDPRGAVHWYGYAGTTPDGREAFRFRNPQAAANGLRGILGHGPAFWESERRSNERMRQQMRGWSGEVVADSELTPSAA